MRLTPRLATARPQRATHLRLQLVASRSQHAIHLALHLIVKPEPVLERRSRRLDGVQRQYVVAELFPSLTDMEYEDGVEFRWRDEDGG